MKRIKLGLIGAGNMGKALLAALLKKKLFLPSEIGATTAHPESLRSLKNQYRIEAFESNRLLTEVSETILLAVKPQQMRGVLAEISPSLKNQLVLTIAAGLDSPFYQRLLPKTVRLIRLMPNSPALIGEGITGFYAPPTVTAEEKELAKSLFATVGAVVEVPQEEWLDIVTALSGSGPAFVYLFIQALLEAGIDLGLPSAIAKQLILQTLIGATRMVENSSESIEKLIERVASKGGTTEAGLKVLKEKRFASLLEETIKAATDRARELRKELSCTS